MSSASLSDPSKKKTVRRTPSRLLKRGVFLALRFTPGAIHLIELAIRILETLGSKSLLYPFYLLAAHYHYGEGVRRELRDSSRACADPDVSLV